MTPDQMTNLAERLRYFASERRREFGKSSLNAAEFDRAADLIESMAQRVPLSEEQIVEAFCRWPGIRHHVEAFKAGVQFAEQAHGIRSEE